MAREVTLFTGQWADLPLEELAAKAAAWGFDGLELACWGDHFEVDKALADDGYVAAKREMLDRHGLKCYVISNHLVGQCVCDFPIDARHQGILPPEIWGDGDAEGVRQRAAERMKDTARAAAKFGVTTVAGFTGSKIWYALAGFPPAVAGMIDAGYQDFADRWNPILDVFDQEGVRFGLEVHPSEIAYDYWTTKRTLEAVDNRPAFGINFDPSHLCGRRSIRSSSCSTSRTVSITLTSRNRSAITMGATARWPPTWSSATCAAAGTSCRRVAARCRSSACSGP